MPVAFIGHGSPMNAVDDNEFVDAWGKLARRLGQPRAIIAVSAHWYTDKTLVTTVEHPQTIHDFGGFPEPLYEMLYRPPGDPELAREVQSLIKTATVVPDESWGLDHGVWVPLSRMFPLAEIPVVQLSLNYNLSGTAHYELGKELRPLRDDGVLILGSGNIVHNLRLIDPATPERGYGWAEEFRQTTNELIQNHENEQLVQYGSMGEAAQKSVPTPEHYWPLLYALGAADSDDQATFFADRCIYGSISMTSVAFGL